MIEPIAETYRTLIGTMGTITYSHCEADQSWEQSVLYSFLTSITTIMFQSLGLEYRWQSITFLADFSKAFVLTCSSSGLQ